MKELYLPYANAYMRYHDFAGEGTALLFVHGLGCASSFDYPQVAWQPQLKGRRIILPDLIGSGYSDKPEGFGYSVADHAKCLMLLIKELGLQKLVLFGHSLGGAVALELYNICPEIFERLIVSEPNLDAGGGSTSRAIAEYSQTEFEATGYAQVLHSAMQNENTQWAASMSHMLPRAAWLISQSAIQGGTPAWRDILYAASCPKTYIFGEKSLPDPDAEILRRHSIKVEVVLGAGHSMAWENPQGLAECIYQGLLE